MSTQLVAAPPSPNVGQSYVAPAQTGPAMAAPMPRVPAAVAARSNSTLLSIVLVIMAVLVLGFLAMKAVRATALTRYPAAGAYSAGDGGYFGY